MTDLPPKQLPVPYDPTHEDQPREPNGQWAEIARSEPLEGRIMMPEVAAQPRVWHGSFNYPPPLNSAQDVIDFASQVEVPDDAIRSFVSAYQLEYKAMSPEEQSTRPDLISSWRAQQVARAAAMHLYAENAPFHDQVLDHRVDLGRGGSATVREVVDTYQVDKIWFSLIRYRDSKSNPDNGRMAHERAYRERVQELLAMTVDNQSIINRSTQSVQASVAQVQEAVNVLRHYLVNIDKNLITNTNNSALVVGNTAAAATNTGQTLDAIRGSDGYSGIGERIMRGMKR